MSITQGLHRSVQQNPDATATICGNRVRTFAELGERVARLASGLGSLGLARGDRISVISANSDRMLEVLLAAAWHGSPFSPLNTRWSAAELAYAVGDVGARVLVVDDAHSSAVPALRDQCPALSAVLFIGDGEPPADMVTAEDLIVSAEAAADIHAADDELAGVFYTGGTTGQSKGAMLSHGNLVTAALGALATGEFMVCQGTALHIAPLFHLAGIWPWVSEMLTGGRHVILPAFTPDAVVEAIRDHEVTDVLLVPTMIQHLVAGLQKSGQTLPALQHLIYAGSPMPEALLGATEKALPNVQLVQAYGMTELAPVATMLGPKEHTGVLRRSAGRAAPHALVRVVDADDRPLPAGQVGEIVVAGGQVMQGYWNQPDASAAALREGWMHTGDAGYLDSAGYVYVVDRIKDMIITGGENVYSVEVENALASHPAVGQCAVIGVQDATWGERVHAVIVLAQGAHALTAEDVRAFVGERIAPYKAPRSIEVVEALPISAAGKILKRELRETSHEPAVGQYSS